MESNNIEYEIDIHKQSNEFETISINKTNLTFEYISRKFEEKGIKFDKRALSLINKDGRYNNAALLLSDQNPFTTKIIVHQGIDIRTLIDKKELNGSIIKQIDESMHHINLFNKTKITFTGEISRQEFTDYPKTALRNIIVNCYSHTNWFLREGVKFEIYANRIEFFSYGKFPNGLTLEEAKIGVTIIRNKIIANVLNQIGYAENFGIGIRRVFTDYANFNEQPKYYICNRGVIVTLFNRNYKHQIPRLRDILN